MSDLISRSALLMELRKNVPEKWDADINYFICNAPTIEAVPVVHGEWVKEENTWVCSVCRKENACAYSEELQRFLDFYCPKCGADMRGKEHT